MHSVYVTIFLFFIENYNSVSVNVLQSVSDIYTKNVGNLLSIEVKYNRFAANNNNWITKLWEINF